ncbi:hypothetical protein B0H19DRAFT_83585 [Mycena capillaripes]|nr:hypothetical protein B0H19DRAFT_83585 [Mycena capillaripes]
MKLQIFSLLAHPLFWLTRYAPVELSFMVETFLETTVGKCFRRGLGCQRKSLSQIGLCRVLFRYYSIPREPGTCSGTTNTTASGSKLISLRLFRSPRLTAQRLVTIPRSLYERPVGI